MPSLLLLLLACRSGQPTPTGPRTVVWVSMDTMRADATGPAFDALAARGVRFDAAVAPAPTTLASHSSMFTGLYPHRHGVPRNEHRLDPSIATVPGEFRAAGYGTAAFLGAMPLDVHTGLVRDFAHVDARFDRARGGLYEQTERRGADVTDAALAWLAEQSGHSFAFVHWYDAHQPYTPDPDFLPSGLEWAPMTAIARARNAPDPRREDQLERLYRSEAAQVDHELGRLVAGLAAQGRADAWIVVTSDHGESLALHADERWDHGWRLYEETIHVPLAIVGPGGPRRVSQPVSLVDLAPTVLSWIGRTLDDLDGRDLGQALAGQPFERGPVFSEATKPFDPPDGGWINAPRWKSVRDGMLKLHLDPTSGEQRLFDLATDPTELVNRVEDPALQADRARLRALVDAWRERADPAPTERVSDAATLEQLRQLGYFE